MTPPNRAIKTILRLIQRPNASWSGAFDVVPRFFMLTNTGLSASCIRIHREMPSNRRDTRNGMRQPQALKASSPTYVRVPMTTRSAANRPRVAVVCIQLVKKPRLPAGACSAT